MSRVTIDADDALLTYLREVSLREPELLARLREETAALPMARMQISPEQGQFMGLLARAIGARRCFEVGTFTGYSALAIGLALPADGHLVAMDVSEEWTSIARRYWNDAGISERIDLRLGPAVDSLTALLDSGRAGSFDLGFIDADKINYRRYCELGLELLRPGGLLLIDNVLWGGSVINPEKQDADTQAIRALNTWLHGNEFVDLSMIPIGDGLTIARKRE
jgi:caffeoyl-CoA O-methyltransferase